MARVPDIVPISDLRQDAAAILKRVRTSSEPVFITQRGRAAAVLINADAFQQAENQRQILYTLARGNKEIATGKGYDLDSVLAEADYLLKEGKR